jgi:hypothetical protein
MFTRSRMPAAIAWASIILLFGTPTQADKRLFTDAFPPAEFAARRAQVMAVVGDGVAVITGAAEQPTCDKTRR